ncbi:MULTISPECIES: type 1 fimbrial protein [Pseudomonas]|jgi:type 1 fimbria pilin|uniref:Type 1 fimbrial protein n=1 Tax=Pseudomonas promysalinigenes TaxID=485898 RepID=A0ABY6AHD0_9PSED|nr:MULTISPECIES: type 1 fimbrial protein [Pseudomonas]UXH38163.1 type 1 fimbrial protein [Pseudomonas promysalinigenes]
MKGFAAATLLCAVSNLCLAAEEMPLHGTIHFSGAVVGSTCTLSGNAEHGLSEHCPEDAVRQTLSVKPVGTTEGISISAAPQSRRGDESEQKYILVGSAGNPITRGQYVITQALQ